MTSTAYPLVVIYCTCMCIRTYSVCVLNSVCTCVTCTIHVQSALHVHMVQFTVHSSLQHTYFLYPTYIFRFIILYTIVGSHRVYMYVVGSLRSVG